jgi:hypothetical protein
MDNKKLMFVEEEKKPRFCARCIYCSWREAGSEYQQDAERALVEHSTTMQHRESVLNHMVLVQEQADGWSPLYQNL